MRADLVFYETPAGGAVFATGSIGWIAALSHAGYDNDVARITANVVRRFAAEQRFQIPERPTEHQVQRVPYFFPDIAAIQELLAAALEKGS